jgi:two-component system LytT family sensor kinase
MRHNRNRFIYMVLTGIAISLLMHAVVPYPQNDHNRIYDFLISIIITVIVWEGNLRIDNFLNEKLPWQKNAGKRILVQLPLVLVFSCLAIFLPMIIFDKYVCAISKVNQATLMLSSLVLGLLISIILLSIEISTQFFSQWKKSIVEVEHYKAESAQAQLQNLKNQLNPHFLFNNMSVLSSLVYKDQDKAVEFINQLSKVYRYILDTKNHELVALEEELKFIKSYTFLLQIRFDKNIVFIFDIPDASEKLLMPPMALQLLVENTIKHNEVSAELPLHVKISANEKELSVSNNLQLRTVNEPSSHTGINNIKERYKFYTTQLVEVINDGKTFTVKIPLLHST